MKERDVRTAMLIGADGLKKIKAARVAVFGIGGVGGHAVDALVRAGIGEIDLFDNDTVSESNINRQLIATYDTIGEYKTEAFKKRIKSINPDCRVNLHTVFVTPDLIEEMSLSDYDYVIDAIDTVSSKIALAIKAEREGINIISSMGTGNKLDPSRLCITDLSKTEGCPLARVMRRELKARGIRHLKVVYSSEPPVPRPADAPPIPDGCTKLPPASVSFVPSAAGLMIASEIVKDLIQS